MKIFSRQNREQPSPGRRKEKKRDLLLLVLSGILLGISFPPFPFPFTLLMFFALTPYFYVIEKRTGLAEISRATYLTFFVFSVITLYWVGSWQKQADPFLMIAGGTLLFFNPLLFLIPSTLLYLSRRIFPKKITLFIFPLFWVTYEYLYTVTDLHFPWLILGHGLAKFTVFIQAADTIGAVGLSIVVLLINIFIYKAFISFKSSRKRFAYNLSFGILIFAAFVIYGLHRLSTFKVSEKTIKVGLIQPNIDPWNKWETNDLSNLTNEYLNLSKEAVNKGAELIVWPETAYPVYLLAGNYPHIVDSIYSFLQKNNIYLLTGMPDVRFYMKGDKIPPHAMESSSGKYYYTTHNAIMLLSPVTRKLQRYGKMKLVPFGERVPFVDQFPFLGKLISWGVGISGWNVGRDTTDFKIPYSQFAGLENKVNSKDSLSIDGVVCFESVFPYFITNFIRRGGQLITIVTNDSWYGNSSGPYQHEDIACLRAVENRRSVIRDANGGISCIIDPLGRIKTSTKMYTKTILVGDVHVETKETFFTKHPMIIPYLSSGFSLWVFGIFILLTIKKKFEL